MKQDFPLYDTVVCGGGFAGLGAAFALSRKGLKVLVLEPAPSLGGEVTRACHLDVPAGIAPLADALCGRIEQAGGRKGNRIDAVIAELCLLRMIEGQFDVLHYCHPVGLATDGRRIAGVVAAGKSGQFVIPARSAIDATGNGLLLKYAGIEVPRPDKIARVYAFFMNGVANRDSLPARIVFEHGELLLKPSVWAGECAVEFASDSSKPCHARLMIPRILAFLRAEFPQMKQAVMSHTAIAELPLAEGADGRAAGAEPAGHLFAAQLPAGVAFRLADRDRLVPELIRSGEEAARRLIGETDLQAKVPDVRDVPVASVVVPPEIRKDVVVCGGGAAGAVAAIVAAREGANTLLVESSCCLGGAATGGAISLYYYGVQGGIQDQIDARVEKLSPLFMGPSKVLLPSWQCPNFFHPDIKKIVLQELLLKAGAEVIFESTACGTETEPVRSALPTKSASGAPRVIKSAVIAGPSGCARCAASVFVDSTGDGDLAAMAGAAFTFGRAADGVPHAYTQSSATVCEDERGFPAILHNNFDAGYCDPTDPRDLTRARIAGLRLYWKEKYNDPVRLTGLAEQIGIRNSRLVCGDRTIAFADQIVGREFPDVIGYSYSHYDNHANDYENESPQAMIWTWALGNHRALIGSEIPYGALLPAGLEGMLVACRALSVDFDGHCQLRMQRDMQRIGEAAGIAAAMAAKSGKTPRSIAVQELQRKLFQSGALRSPETGYHCRSWRPEGFFPDLRKRSLIGEPNAEGVDLIVRCAADETSLLARLDSTDKKESATAALLLGAAGNKAVMGKLIACVKAKEGVGADGAKCVPFWKPAIAVLGWNKCQEAVPALEAILGDPSADQAALVLALNALGDIGNRKSAAAIRGMLSRTDLPCEQVFAVGGWANQPAVKADARWKIELTAAATLARLGCPDGTIAAKYLDDDRLPVRRRARSVLEGHAPACPAV
jgi:NADPH-dependent 2,4-dienoyl-CoA reductase/sulfur reductase-like enzyme